MAQEPALLRIQGVTKRFSGVTALDGVNLTLERGEVHSLVGENGAGKSTLIKIMTGDPFPRARSVGSMTCAGEDRQSEGRLDA